MEQIKKILQERESQLQQLKKEKEKALTKAPKGSLRLCQHGDKIQYYHRNNPKDFNGVYIKEKDIELAKQLAQKDYDKKVITSAERELGAINKFFLNYPKCDDSRFAFKHIAFFSDNFFSPCLAY